MIIREISKTEISERSFKRFFSLKTPFKFETIISILKYEDVPFYTHLLHGQNRISLKKGKSCERKV